MRYLCLTEYLATGEGFHLWLSIEIAENEKEAKVNHLSRLGVDDFFQRGTYVISEMYPNLIREYLSPYFSKKIVEGLVRDNFKGLSEFKFSLHRNYS